MAAELIAGGVAFVLGLAAMLVGGVAIDAGKGGYGTGPFPMVPVPRDNGLIVVGVGIAVVGAVVAGAGLEVMSA